MSKKVLVFESDAAFAGELRNELAKLGCNTNVVDDGNVGLQQAASDRPDLILLSIELPRMNGFSVCNKLKKDPALKDVPLIIMSSESSEETFEQHRKLRTRAEDYVHKPIAFGELLQHIQPFVRLVATSSPAPGVPSEGGIVIDDEIAINSGEYVEDDSAMTQIGQRPDFVLKPKPAVAIDKDVNDFADSAFDMLTGPSAPSAPDAAVLVQNGTPAPAAALAGGSLQHTSPSPQPNPRHPASMPPLPRQSSLPPRPAGIDVAEHERVKAELEKAKTRAADLEKDLGAAKGDISRLQQDATRGSKSDAESQRMQREIDELKAKIAAGAKAGGGISSRDFLDLREALNKKDKEILALREGLTKKDKDAIDAQDKLLIVERAKADLEDKGLALERELGDAKEKIEATIADKELAKKAGEDFKTRFERAKAESEAKGKEAEATKAKHAEELAAGEAAKAKLKTELEQILTRERAENQKSLEQAEEVRKGEVEQAEATRRSDLEQALRDRDAAVNEVREEAAREKAEAIATRETALKTEADSKLASLHRAHQQEVERVKADFAQKDAAAAANSAAELAAAEERRAEDLRAAEQAAAARLSDRESELEAKRAAEVAEIERERDARIDALKSENHERVASLENDRDARLAAMEARTNRELAEGRAVAEAEKAAADERIATLDRDLSAVNQELAALKEAKAMGDAASAASAADLEQRLAKTTSQRDTHERDLQQARDRVAVLEAELASMRQDLGETKERLSTESGRAEKAFAKWDSDRGSLERAKDALAVALAQIEEAEARSINGG